MKEKIYIVCALALLTLPGAVAAQMHGGGGMMGSGQHMTGQDNTDMMNQTMAEIRQMTGSHRMTPEQQQQMREMMNQLNQMKQEMQGPQGPQMEPRHTQQLQKMRENLQDMKSQMK